MSKEEEVILTIRLSRDLENTDRWNWSRVEKEVLDIEIPQVLQGGLMREAVKDEAGINLEEFDEYEHYSTVSELDE